MKEIRELTTEQLKIYYLTYRKILRELNKDKIKGYNKKYYKRTLKTGKTSKRTLKTEQKNIHKRELNVFSQ
jgi:hypothetical protein